jgi:hypothetical protein
VLRQFHLIGVEHAALAWLEHTADRQFRKLAALLRIDSSQALHAHVTFLTRRRAFMQNRADFTWNFYANSADEFFHDP